MTIRILIVWYRRLRGRTRKLLNGHAALARITHNRKRRGLKGELKIAAQRLFMKFNSGHFA
jgi:hypothetical protein